MNIREKIAAMVVAHTPAGGNATNRTRALMHKLISHYYPKHVEVDESALNVCEWEDATEYIYLGSAHAIVIGGMVTPLMYGRPVDVRLAWEIREAGMRILPINPRAVVKESLTVEPVIELEKPKRTRKKAALITSAAV